MRRLAIVGRPNVGKSTLFNRLAGKRLALVDDRPGVTRDRREAEIRLGTHDLILIDTAGFEDATDESLEARMRTQTEAAIAAADHILFVIDARAGVTPLDETFADLVRRAGVPVTVIANKCEGRAAEAGVLDAYALGLGEPIPFSAEHGLGMGDLEATLDEAFGDATAIEGQDAADTDAGPMRIAVVGRPNAGKSTLINRLIGAERLLTGPEAGITRDAIAVDWAWRDHPVQIVDTAGLRKRARVVDRVEKLSVGDTINTIRFAHIVILIVDIAQPFEKQDLQIADLAIREGRALVIAVNKIDGVADLDEKRREIREMVQRLLPQVRGVPLHFISAKTGRGIDRMMDHVLDIYDVWNRRIATSALNDWLADALARHPPPAPGGRRIKIRYLTQATARPPTFVAFSQRAGALPASYKRYLVNGLRDAFDLDGVPIRLHIRAGKNPYADRKN